MELKNKELKMGDRIKLKKKKVIILSEGIVESTAEKNEIVFVKFDGLAESIPECTWLFKKVKQSQKNHAPLVDEKSDPSGRGR